MKLFLFLLALVVGHFTVIGQVSLPRGPNDQTKELIRKIKGAQDSVNTISYSLERTDTLVTGDTRKLTGKALIRGEKSDSLFGFYFQVKMDGNPGESVYGGRIAYETDDSERVYTAITNPTFLPHILWEQSGRIILPDLVRLDTTGAVGFESWQDSHSIYLRINYPDLLQYDVSRRSKTLIIDPVSLLPVAMRSHQETLGKVQDLYYRITALRVNDPGFDYDFALPGFLANYRQRVPAPERPLLLLKGLDAPAFTLSSFEGAKISLQDMRGKVVLLDFWEVWCGPCVESMPRVQGLYDRYRDKGLRVFGVINEVKQLKPSELLVAKRKIRYPMLVGNERLRRDYRVAGVPLLILIDRTGKVVWVSVGFTEELEEVIRREVG